MSRPWRPGELGHVAGSEPPTQEEFANLLAFLGPDEDRAAGKYEQIRGKLIRIFTCRGSAYPEELADVTINRVARKSGELRTSYIGDPTLYFCGVARNVFHESVRERKPPLTMPEPDPAEEKQILDDCLEKCMDELVDRNRYLIMEYYRGRKGADKIECRKKLAKRLGLEMNGLRIRAHRLRKKLRKCVGDCLELNAVG